VQVRPAARQPGAPGRLPADPQTLAAERRRSSRTSSSRCDTARSSTSRTSSPPTRRKRTSVRRAGGQELRRRRYLERGRVRDPGVFQLPVDAAGDGQEIRRTMDELQASSVWREGIEYKMSTTTTVLWTSRSRRVRRWSRRSSGFIRRPDLPAELRPPHPMVAVPVSLIGTLGYVAPGVLDQQPVAVRMVLAIGIGRGRRHVVVENVETHLARGLSRGTPPQAMTEVTGRSSPCTGAVRSVRATAFMAASAGSSTSSFALTSPSRPSSRRSTR